LSLGKHDTLLNPTLLVEVLSDSTEAFDRGDKLDAYTGVSSVQQVVLVSSKRRHVELYSREPDGAFRRTAVSGAGTIELASLPVTLPLAEVYEGTDELMAPG
jgi:Uma2 family endonuclease